nr:hypothetical protein [Mesorhizobium sp.]
MITFDQLIPLYRSIAFSDDGTEGRLTIRDHSVLETVRELDASERASEDAAIAFKDPVSLAQIGSSLDVSIGAPRSGLGQLALNLDALLASGRNRVQEPPRFYLIKDHFAYNDSPVIDGVHRYRTVLRFIHALKEAAAFLDPYQGEMLFLGPTRLAVPVNYRLADLQGVTPALVEEFEAFVFQKVHKDQKEAIASSTLVETCRATPEPDRFAHLLRNLREFVTKCYDSYRLFASEFSYEKIRSKAEEAIGDYASKIHRTFHDIQNQVLGIPVATVVVATQMKVAAECDVNFWANLAVALGATLFVVLLTFAVSNQIMTLSSIERDLTRQKTKLSSDYTVVSAEFLPLYGKLETRICMHSVALWGIGACCIAGVVLTWFIFAQLTTPKPWACF